MTADEVGGANAGAVLAGADSGPQGPRRQPRVPTHRVGGGRKCDSIRCPPLLAKAIAILCDEHLQGLLRLESDGDGSLRRRPRRVRKRLVGVEGGEGRPVLTGSKCGVEN